VKARIAEVFDSVQGEGLYLGERQVFVRFFGCNLSCSFCDTKLNRFLEYEPDELFREIKLYPDDFHSVSFTGGEPLLQHEFLRDIIKLNKKHGLKNYLETNGTLYQQLEDVIDDIDIVAMDVKLPSSSGMGQLWGMHYRFLKIASQKETFIKAIISEETVSDDLKAALALIREVNRSCILVLQPNSLQPQERLKTKLDDFSALCLRERVTACVIPQMHKVMGVK